MSRAAACAQWRVPGRRAPRRLPAAALENFAGEYTDSYEPDTPLSFYVQNGKLTFESERIVPTELKPASATSFSIPDTKITVRFTVDDAGHADSVRTSDEPEIVYRRSGEAVHHVFHDYQRSEVMIPMRDGVKLHAVILKPTDITEPLPFLIQRTPYGVDGTNRSSFFRQRPELARDGYIYVGEDIRGRYKSEGEFVMSRPLADHHDGNPARGPVDESTDTYDTVDMAAQECFGQQRARRFRGDQLSGLSGHDGGDRSAPRGEGDFAAGPDDRRVDGRRFLS